MSPIDVKYAELKQHGLDLGAPKGAEKDAGYGGRVREYANGNVYYHPNTGAHEVHGGILTCYLANGGPGVDPSSGERRFGFPQSDEIQELPRYSLFETGAIYWTPEADVCPLYGPIGAYVRTNDTLGAPVTGIVPVAGGHAAYFEGGVVFTADGSPVHRVLTAKLVKLYMGKPRIVDPSADEERRFYGLVAYGSLSRADYDALVAWRPSLFTDLWSDRLSLTAVGEPNAKAPLIAFHTHTDESTGEVALSVDFEAFPNGVVDLKDRTLYDLRFSDGARSVAVSPHCVYVKKDWESFGLLHATDIHINARNEGFRDKLKSVGLNDAAAHYSNFQDNFRDFIKYANHLHAIGLADVVWATGDLVDYVHEDGPSSSPDNFVRFRNLILGRAMDLGGPVSDELRLPIFTSFGNHDYRIVPYHLRASVEIPEHDTPIDQYDAHNLIEGDAVAIQDGKTPIFGITTLNDALAGLQYDRGNDEVDYRFYKENFNDPRSFVVSLGKHRLVMLDTQMDDGVPADANLAFLLDYVRNNVPPATQQIVKTNAANLVGLTANDLTLLKAALGEAGADGVVIVGIHAPAIAQRIEYPYYFRETISPTADPKLMGAYIRRHGLKPEGFVVHAPYFKFGDVTNGLSDGGFNGDATEFLKLCAGVGASRPVDLILCGHKHDFVEHRFKWNAALNRLEFYHDFYTENPSVYYATVNDFAQNGVPAGAAIEPHVVPGAPLGAALTRAVDNRDRPGHASGTVYGTLDVPPYADPLLSTKDPKTWWAQHRPLHAMTSALGPIEQRTRYGTFYKTVPPEKSYRPVIESDVAPQPSGSETVQVVPSPFRQPTFQGFRVVLVGGGTIQRMHYVRLAELRQNDLKMPWEPLGTSGGISGAIAPGGPATTKRL